MSNEKKLGSNEKKISEMQHTQQNNPSTVKRDSKLPTYTTETQGMQSGYYPEMSKSLSKSFSNRGAGEQVEYLLEAEPEEFDMSEMDESAMNSSFRGNSRGEDSVANRPGDRTSKNKNLHIF